MSAPTDRAAQLERLMVQALSRHAPLPAPSGLEARVLAEIERRAQLPWWQRRLVAWPRGARLALAAACVVAGLACVSAVRWLGGELQEVLTTPAVPLLLQARHAGQLLLALGHAGTSLLAAIPPQYVYASVALAALAYVVIFATAALAYRVLAVGTPQSQPLSSR